MVFAGEAAWRWRMLLPSTDRSYETFWRQSMRWVSLGATDPVTVFPIPASGPGDRILVRLAVRDDEFNPVPGADVDVRVTGPGGRMETLRATRDVTDGEDPGLFVAAFEPADPGVYRLTVTAAHGGDPLGSATASALVGGADSEMADPRLNTAVLERLAASTGGRVLATDELDGLGELLRVGLPAASYAVRDDAWHNAWSFGLLIGLLLSEWLLRRRWGLR